MAAAAACQQPRGLHLVLRVPTGCTSSTTETHPYGCQSELEGQMAVLDTFWTHLIGPLVSSFSFLIVFRLLTVDIRPSKNLIKKNLPFLSFADNARYACISPSESESGTRERVRDTESHASKAPTRKSRAKKRRAA